MSEKRPMILVVDDEADICDLMSDRLGLEGFETCTAGSGNEAVTVLKSRQDIDLIITDVRMPDGDGLLVLEESTKLNPNLPVVIITGFSDFPEDELRKRGATAVISKPINYDELLSVINTNTQQA